MNRRMQEYQLIEDYLKGRLDAETRGALEKKAKEQPGFQKELNTYKYLIKGVQEAALRKSLDDVRKRVVQDKVFRATKWGILGGLALAGIGLVFGWTPYTDKATAPYPLVSEIELAIVAQELGSNQLAETRNQTAYKSIQQGSANPQKSFSISIEPYPAKAKEDTAKEATLPIEQALPAIMEEKPLKEAEGIEVDLTDLTYDAYVGAGLSALEKGWYERANQLFQKAQELEVPVDTFLNPYLQQIEKMRSQESVRVPAGYFKMGSNQGRERDHKPTHRIATDAYWIDRYEVTVKDFCQFLNEVGDKDSLGRPYLVMQNTMKAPFSREEGAYTPTLLRANWPIYGVTWYGANAYAHYVGKRLPTEAEWERAAKMGGIDKFPRGLSELLPVHESLKDHLGLYGMRGSVGEWCSDWYDPVYYQKSPPNNPQGPYRGKYKVIRSGIKANQGSYNRAYAVPGFGYAGDDIMMSVGFRCVIDG